tara:strand:- start:34 stop:279 length:246 start_codon:yes stop_codon:yes gene_type:complete
MQIIKNLTILANLGFLIFIVVVFIIKGIPNHPRIFLFSLGLIITLALNAYFLSVKRNGGWLKMFLKRKALEEKRKIRELER